MAQSRNTNSGSAPLQHIPVMLGEAVEGLAVKAGGRYLDGTFGRGGHARAVLSRLGPDGRLLATPFAVVTGLTYNFLPFMVLPLFASIDKIDYRLIEAGGDLYANPVVGFFKVTWPLSLPGVISGTLLTFIPASGDYINAELLGNPTTRMIGNDIQDLFSAGALPEAASLSVTLMALIVVMVLVYVRRAGTEELV